MASFAELLTGIASKTAESVGEGINESISRGAQLAQQMQNMQVQRQELEQKKAEAESAKFEKVGGWFETYSKMPEGAAKKAFGRKFIPTGISALGIQDKIDPNVLEMMTSDPNLSAFLVSEIRNGRMDMSALTRPDKVASMFAKSGEQFGDLEKFKAGVSEALPELQEAEKLSILEIGKSKRVEQGAQFQMGKQVQGQTAAPFVEQGKKIADTAANFVTKDKSDIANALDMAERSLNKLENKKIKTGGMLKGLAGKFETVQASTDPELKALMDDVRGLINIREQLGDPNPTEQQINQILNRIINPALPNEANAQKLRDYIKKRKDSLELQQNEFIKRGFMNPADKLEYFKEWQGKKYEKVGGYWNEVK